MCGAEQWTVEATQPEPENESQTEEESLRKNERQRGNPSFEPVCASGTHLITSQDCDTPENVLPKRTLFLGVGGGSFGSPGLSVPVLPSPIPLASQKN